MPTGHSLATLADVSDRQSRHGPPELVVGCKHSVIPVPMLARRRDEIGEPVQELKRGELDDAVRSRSRGLSGSPPAAARLRRLPGPQTLPEEGDHGNQRDAEGGQDLLVLVTLDRACPRFAFLRTDVARLANRCACE
jgi:hypothetical protein